LKHKLARDWEKTGGEGKSKICLENTRTKATGGKPRDRDATHLEQEAKKSTIVRSEFRMKQYSFGSCEGRTSEIVAKEGRGDGDHSDHP